MTRPPRSEWKPEPITPRQNVRALVNDFCQALLINDGAAARSIGRKLNCVGVSPQQRRFEIERWREANPNAGLEAWFEAYRRKLEAQKPERTYCPTRPFNLADAIADSRLTYFTIQSHRR